MYVENYEHPIGTLATNLLNPMGGANMYEHFLYLP